MPDVHAGKVNALYEALAVIYDEHGRDVVERLAAGLLVHLDRRSHEAVAHDLRRREDWRGDGNEPSREYNAAVFTPDCGHASDVECTEACRRAEVAGQVHLARLELGLEDLADVDSGAPFSRARGQARTEAHAARATELRKLVKVSLETADLAEGLGLGEPTLRAAHAVLRNAREHLRDVAGAAPLCRDGRPPKRDAEMVGIVRQALERADLPSSDADAANQIYGTPIGGDHNEDGKLTKSSRRRSNALRMQRSRRGT